MRGNRIADHRNTAQCDGPLAFARRADPADRARVAAAVKGLKLRDYGYCGVCGRPRHGRASPHR